MKAREKAIAVEVAARLSGECSSKHCYCAGGSRLHVEFCWSCKAAKCGDDPRWTPCRITGKVTHA